MKNVLKIILTLKTALIFTIFTSCFVQSNTLLTKATVENLTYNDISLLWTPPKTKAELDLMIRADFAIGTGGVELWPEEDFRSVMNKVSSAYLLNKFDDAFHTEIDTRANWRVVGLRIDPSALGTTPDLINTYGVLPQIRLVLQPMWLDNTEQLQVLDFAVHLSYNYNLKNTYPFEPDMSAFSRILNDLGLIKSTLLNAGVVYEPGLGEHPGFSDSASLLSYLLRYFLHEHLSEDSRESLLTSFIGVGNHAKAWVFINMFPDRNDTPIYQTFDKNQESGKSLIGARIHNALNTNFKGKGVNMASIHPLRRDKTLFKRRVFESTEKPTYQHVPNIIRNPHYSNAINTDCASCHSPLPVNFQKERETDFKYKFTEHSEPVVRTEKHPWGDNVFRNFGWFGHGALTEGIKTYVSHRTVNETDNALNYIKKTYQIKLK